MRMQITHYYARQSTSGPEITELSKRPFQFAWLKETERDFDLRDAETRALGTRMES